MLSYRFNLLFVVACFSGLAACAAQPGTTQMAVTGRPALSPVPSGVPTPTPMLAGAAYLLLRTPSPPYIYQIAQVPISCLVAGAGCANWGKLPALPGSSYAPGISEFLSWSPDGTLAIFQNTNTMQSFTFDPATQTFALIADLPVVNDQVIWSPDSQWAAMPVQGGDAYASHIVLVNPHTRQLRTVGADWSAIDGLLGVLNLTRMQYPLGWLSPDDLLVFSQRYGSGNGLSSKKDLATGGLYRLNVLNGALTPLAESPDWTQVPSMAPQGNLVAIPVRNGLSIRKADQINTSRFQFVGSSVRWSPDGQWLAALSQTQPGNELVFIPADGGSMVKVQLDSPLYTLAWLTDSEHVLVATPVDDPDSAADRGGLLMVSVVDGSAMPADIPGLHLSQYFVAGLSIRP